MSQGKKEKKDPQTPLGTPEHIVLEIKIKVRSKGY